MRELIKRMLRNFCTITTGTMIASTVFITFLEGEARFGVEVLWQILMLSVFATLLTLILYSRKEISKRATIVRQLVHYLLLNVLIVGGALSFSWLDMAEIGKLIILLLLNLLVYLFVWVTDFVKDQKQAAFLNEKLKDYQRNK